MKEYFFTSSITSFKSEYSLDFSAKSFLSTSPDDNSFSSNECLEIKSSIVFMRNHYNFLSSSAAFFST